MRPIVYWGLYGESRILENYQIRNLELTTFQGCDRRRERREVNAPRDADREAHFGAQATGTCKGLEFSV